MWTKSSILILRVCERSGLRDRSGSTAMEYALIGTGIGVAIIAAIFAIGDEMQRMFDVVQTALNDATN